jgi:hypothetical protein
MFENFLVYSLLSAAGELDDDCKKGYSCPVTYVVGIFERIMAGTLALVLVTACTVAYRLLQDRQLCNKCLAFVMAVSTTVVYGILQHVAPFFTKVPDITGKFPVFENFDLRKVFENFDLRTFVQRYGLHVFELFSVIMFAAAFALTCVLPSARKTWKVRQEEEDSSEGSQNVSSWYLHHSFSGPGKLTESKKCGCTLWGGFVNCGMWILGGIVMVWATCFRPNRVTCFDNFATMVSCWGYRVLCEDLDNFINTVLCEDPENVNWKFGLLHVTTKCS